MKILLGNYRLTDLGGTEMWTRTMFDALSSEHDVQVVSVLGNTIWPDMPAYDPSTTYDLAIINHGETVRHLRKARVRRLIMVMHGVLPALEWPVFGADRYVAVTEEVRSFVPVKASVIPNPIDIERFRTDIVPSEKLSKVVMMSNYETQAFRLMRDACQKLRVELRTAGYASGGGTAFRPEELIEWADLVVGVGRVALEGMAAGRNVYSLGQTGDGGMITESNIDQLARTNFKGAPQHSWPTPQELADYLSNDYDPQRNLLPYVRQRHDPSTVVEQFLDLATSIPPHTRLLNKVLRRGPEAFMSARAMTLADPFLREAQKRVPVDGRPGVLSKNLDL